MMAGLPPFYDTNMQVRCSCLVVCFGVCAHPRSLVVSCFCFAQRMYEKIMSAELRFPRQFDEPTRDLLSKMLTREVKDRLGSNGSNEIKCHRFFDGLDWDAVVARRVKPEFVPPKRCVVLCRLLSFDGRPSCHAHVVVLQGKRDRRVVLRQGVHQATPRGYSRQPQPVGDHRSSCHTF